MAALRFEASADGRIGVHRLAHHDIYVDAHTYDTHVRVHIERDGSALVTITRKGEATRTLAIGAEGVPSA